MLLLVNIASILLIGAVLASWGRRDRERIAARVAAVDGPVVASGGVSSMDDILALKGIPGLMGAITGKAVYEGLLDVEAAIRACGQ